MRHPVIGQRAVRPHQPIQPRRHRAYGQAQPILPGRPAVAVQPGAAQGVEPALKPDAGQQRGRRHVAGVRQRLPRQQRAQVVAIGIGDAARTFRRIGHHVAGREHAVVERQGIQERLERAAGGPQGGAEVHGPARPRVPAGGGGVGQDLVRAAMHYHDRALLRPGGAPGRQMCTQVTHRGVLHIQVQRGPEAGVGRVGCRVARECAPAAAPPAWRRAGGGGRAGGAAPRGPAPSRLRCRAAAAAARGRPAGRRGPGRRAGAGWPAPGPGGRRPAARPLPRTGRQRACRSTSARHGRCRGCPPRRAQGGDTAPARPPARSAAVRATAVPASISLAQRVRGRGCCKRATCMAMVDAPDRPPCRRDQAARSTAAGSMPGCCQNRRSSRARVAATTRGGGGVVQ